MDIRDKKMTLENARYIVIASIGGIDPNNPLSEEKHTAQTAELNRLLSGYPRGTIIGKDTAIGRYMVGEHELCMQKTSYHIAFPRKPEWIYGYANAAR